MHLGVLKFDDALVTCRTQALDFAARCFLNYGNGARVICGLSGSTPHVWLGSAHARTLGVEREVNAYVRVFRSRLPLVNWGQLDGIMASRNVQHHVKAHYGLVLFLQVIHCAVRQ